MLWFLTYGIITFTICEGKVLTQVNIADPMQQFSNDMYRILGQAESGNMVYSPYSIHTTMAMVLGGAPKDSNTYKQLAKVLGAEDISLKSFYIDLSLLRSFYGEVQRRNKNVEEECQTSTESDYDYEEPCDNDPNLDILTSHRIFAKEGLDIKDDYTLGLDAFFRAGKQFNLNTS